MAALSSAADEIDTTKAHPARMYDFYLDGKDHFEADEEAARSVQKIFPSVGVCAKTNRLFMNRATRWLAQEAGVRQFLDIGTGIPTRPNLHQIAQEARPDARIVYVDYDPIVLRHAEALMRSTPEGRTAYIQADVREPESITGHQELHHTLDLDEPVALSLNALLHFVPDSDKPYEIVRHLVDQLAPGSHLVLTHATPDFEPSVWGAVLEVYHANGISAAVRTKDEVLSFFDGLEIVEPGIVPPHRWRPTSAPLEGADDESVSLYAGVARKP